MKGTWSAVSSDSSALSFGTVGRVLASYTIKPMNRPSPAPRGQMTKKLPAPKSWRPHSLQEPAGWDHLCPKVAWSRIIDDSQCNQSASSAATKLGRRAVRAQRSILDQLERPRYNYLANSRVAHCLWHSSTAQLNFPTNILSINGEVIFI